MGDLLQEHLLWGQKDLCREVSAFVVRHRRAIAQQAPLPVSLQFVDLCPTADFEEVMRELIAELPSRRHDELAARTGDIKLFLTAKRSDVIVRFMRHRRRRIDRGRDHSRGREIALPNPHHVERQRLLSPQQLIDRGFDLVDVMNFGGRIVFPTHEQDRQPRHFPRRNIRNLDHLDHSDLYS